MFLFPTNVSGVNLVIGIVLTLEQWEEKALRATKISTPITNYHYSVVDTGVPLVTPILVGQFWLSFQREQKNLSQISEIAIYDRFFFLQLTLPNQ